MKNRTFSILAAALLASACAHAAPDNATAAQGAAQVASEAATQVTLPCTIPFDPADVEELLKASAEGDLGALLRYAAGKGDTENLRCLLGAGADVNAADDDGFTALMAAARGGHTDTARLLIEKGANVNATNESHGRSALLHAIWEKDEHTDTVRLLIEKGADVNIADTIEGNTAYRTALHRNHNQIIKLLVAAGARDAVVPKAPKVVDPKVKRKLLGKHLFSLHWISWEKFGTATITEDKGKLKITAEQKTDREYARLNGVIEPVNMKMFYFTGDIVTRVLYPSFPNDCKRTGTFLFEATGTRRYWRLQQMTNPCDGKTDYIDIFFNKK